ncbi:MAG: phytoene/squalene synthase family protein [Planctomycetota bacterium]
MVNYAIQFSHEKNRLDDRKLELDFDSSADEEEVIAVHSKSFAFASRLLPKSVRNDVCKLYAWCRWCDNAVDDAPDQQTANDRLEALRSDIERIYRGDEVLLPASGWFSELVDRYQIPKHLPLDLLKGMETDLNFEPIQDERDLELYCYRVAGVVGLMMCRLMGVSNPLAYENANRLGIAMQMTNISRDIAEDRDRGRCYLPQNWLAKSDQLPSNEEVKQSVRRLLTLADQNYKIGRQGYDALSPGCRLAIRVAAAVYREIGNEISRHDYDVMSRRHHVSTTKKVMLVGGELVLEGMDRLRSRIPAWGLKKAQSNIISTSTIAQPFTGESQMNSQFHFLVVFGLSMTLVMATVLFALVGINPKLSDYQTLPWVYSGVSAAGAAALWFWAQAIGKRLDEIEQQEIA